MAMSNATGIEKTENRMYNKLKYKEIRYEKKY